MAIDVADRPFDSFVFVEQNPAYALELQKLKAEFPNRDIHIEQADANVFLPDWCQSRSETLGVPWQRQRAVIFLDPFATEVNWQTVAAIAETKSVDLWIWFPISALSRILPRLRQPEEPYASTADRILGSSEWRDELYQTRTQMTLFGDEEALANRSDQQAIVDFYLRKLDTVFEKVAPSPRWFRNSNNTPLFALLFAAANPAGAPIAVRIAENLLKQF